MASGGTGSGGAAAPGVFASLRSLAATSVGIVRTRLQLLANDLEEQRVRVLQLVVLAAIALFCGAVAVLLASAWLVIALWDQYRLWTLGVLTAVYACGCLIALGVMKSRAAERPKAFSASLSELSRDEELLRQ